MEAHIVTGVGAQREILALGEAGYREVTLLGQNVDAYGRDLPGAAADGSGDCDQQASNLLYSMQAHGAHRSFLEHV